jgi:hypothetical protein
MYNDTIFKSKGGITMYKKIEPPLRMTSNEASEKYPDSYILIRMNSMNPSDDICTVLYIGDERREMFSLIKELKDPKLCGVYEGLNHQRRCLGGVVVNA